MDQAYDIIVAGAGPGGSTLARHLRGAGLRIALIDKATFPRDKICGDAIPGTAVAVGKRMDPGFWRGLPALHRIGRARGVAPSGAKMDLSFVTEGYSCPRLAFDAYLLRQAEASSTVTTYLGQKIRQVARTAGGHRVSLADGTLLTAKMIVGADGAHSAVAKAYTDTKLDRDHHCAAVRAYYRGVTGIGHDRLTFYFLKDYLPGYFWIFPLADGLFNVGFGMLSRQISERRVDLRASLDRIAFEDRNVRHHFTRAERVSPNEGFGLPLGSRNVPRSGDGFVLLGDAAGLVDPITGEGIGNAMISAELAAATVRAAFAAGRFDAGFLAAYDRAVRKRFDRDFRRKYLAQKLVSTRPWLLDGIIRAAAGTRLGRWVTKQVV